MNATMQTAAELFALDAEELDRRGQTENAEALRHMAEWCATQAQKNARGDKVVKDPNDDVGFCKIRFVGPEGATAGLVMHHRTARQMTVAQLSRCFPVGEFRKMSRVEVSPKYPSWDEAFSHVFDGEAKS